MILEEAQHLISYVCCTRWDGGGTHLENEMIKFYCFSVLLNSKENSSNQTFTFTVSTTLPTPTLEAHTCIFFFIVPMLRIFLRSSPLPLLPHHDFLKQSKLKNQT